MKLITGSACREVNFFHCDIFVYRQLRAADPCTSLPAVNQVNLMASRDSGNGRSAQLPWVYKFVRQQALCIFFATACLTNLTRQYHDDYYSSAGLTTAGSLALLPAGGMVGIPFAYS
jgi:hypothetical protein